MVGAARMVGSHYETIHPPSNKEEDVKLVYAKTQFSATKANGQIEKVFPGMAWAADDPFVKEHKTMFSDVPVKARTSHGWVETATAGPGEKRRSGR